MYLELGGIKGCTPKNIFNPLQMSDGIWRWPLGRLKHVKAEYLDVRRLPTSLWKCYLKSKTNLLVLCSALPTTLYMRGLMASIYKCRTPLAGCGAHARMQDPSAFSPFGQRILIFGCMTARRCARCSLGVFQLLWPACYEGRPDVLQAVQCNGA